MWVVTGAGVVVGVGDIPRVLVAAGVEIAKGAVVTEAMEPQPINNTSLQQSLNTKQI